MTIWVTTMRLVSVKEFRDRATVLLRSADPVLITRRGKAAGLYLPLDEVASLPLELRRELHLAIAESIRRSLQKAGVTEEEILEDFKRFQRRRKAGRRR
jgi:PHD/YefM family antitoxin component YafN of YafNO toxin-antitoxin module